MNQQIEGTLKPKEEEFLTLVLGTISAEVQKELEAHPEMKRIEDMGSLISTVKEDRIQDLAFDSNVTCQTLTKIQHANGIALRNRPMNIRPGASPD
ncbi:hypothetical protein FD05_GL000427 [Lentilactobacillus otakiensis DSM 19908 = JCM 15040]|uniref:Uncharacterized protein n=1 Tax=Lentilactobacillus otakiensis DSM 19908 = JCM 15040 TaxID=1423780 RepID=S4PP56_9LACO|nr:hypothetical protein FD05_GL000427 [Lentilactobacillus otakiensis DSM 19908 = JCM 15040]GAD16275.1 hypothetical protein LOT_0813 [Lentilactobacillus otakiensis DSM 19908 = JCM 15040]